DMRTSRWGCCGNTRNYVGYSSSVTCDAQFQRKLRNFWRHRPDNMGGATAPGGPAMADPKIPLSTGVQSLRSERTYLAHLELRQRLNQIQKSTDAGELEALREEAKGYAILELDLLDTIETARGEVIDRTQHGSFEGVSSLDRIVEQRLETVRLDARLPEKPRI